jgi:hypothetical protein
MRSTATASKANMAIEIAQKQYRADFKQSFGALAVRPKREHMFATHAGRFKPISSSTSLYSRSSTWAIEPLMSEARVVISRRRLVTKFVDEIQSFVLRVFPTKRWKRFQITLESMRVLDIEMVSLMWDWAGLRYFRADRYGIAENEIRLGRAIYARCTTTFGTGKFPPIDNDGACLSSERVRKDHGDRHRHPKKNARLEHKPTSVHTKRSWSMTEDTTTYERVRYGR